MYNYARNLYEYSALLASRDNLSSNIGQSNLEAFLKADKELEEFRKSILLEMTEKYLKDKELSRNVSDFLNEDFRQLPLMINSMNPIESSIAKWRLEKGV